MSIGPTIENLRKKRAEEAALLKMFYAPPPVAESITEAEFRARAATDQQRRKDQDTFGDTTMRMAAPYFDSAIELAANAGRRPTYFSDPIMGGLERAGQYTGDMALATLSGLLGLPYAGAGFLGEVFGGDESSERRLARDLAAGFEVAGVGPEARALGSVARTALSGRATPETARGFLAGESGSLPLPFKADDPAQARGAQIIDMLTSGRAGEITDEMLDLGDPVMNTRLNEYLFRNYDLPMDEASRMARAQERFNRDVYRGGVSGEIIGNPKSSTQYFAYEPEIATEYALNRTDAGNGDFSGATVGRFMVSAQDRAQGDDVFDAYERITGLGRNSLEYDRSWVPMHYDYTGTPVVEAVESSLKRDGYDSVFFADDAAPMSGVEHDTLAILDPRTNVRSRFARFDPRLAHLRNLSAGVAGGVPLGLMSMTTNEEQY